ncbi:transposase-like zinc-binding domain-containing protein [Leptothermofonsia sp. ETS-13]
MNTKCFQCNSTQTSKNGHRRGKQCYKCKHCG